jgi:cyclopropane fatty-acyl-phospholipid synthase-like methyltransferase
MMKQEAGTVCDWLWNKFRSSDLWRFLRGVPFLRSGSYLAIEVFRMLHEPRTASLEVVDGDFLRCNDPWKYETNPLEQARFLKQTELLDAARGDRPFQFGLEIGCAEGLYTEILAERCESLLVLDLSPTALARTQSRCGWSERVRFNAFDLRNEAIPGTFDLIVVAGVLEYFSRPYTFFRVRKKLTGALRPNGYLLVETTRANPVVENAWWGRRLIRGRWINVFVSEHSSLAIISAATTDSCSITLYRRVESSRVQ